MRSDATAAMARLLHRSPAKLRRRVHAAAAQRNDCCLALRIVRFSESLRVFARFKGTGRQ